MSRKSVHAALLLLSCLLIGLFPKTASALDYRNWAAVIVSGSDRMENGTRTAVFDNARIQLHRLLIGAGFAPAHIAMLSAADTSVAPADIGEFSRQLARVSSQATEGCFIYLTSHGVKERGMRFGIQILSTRRLADLISAHCDYRPMVLVISACYSGQFITPLINERRLILSAARSTNESWDCVRSNIYNCFDNCFLEQLRRSLGGPPDFVRIASGTVACVQQDEARSGVSPSEPRVYLGAAYPPITFRGFGEAPIPAASDPAASAPAAPAPATPDSAAPAPVTPAPADSDEEEIP